MTKSPILEPINKKSKFGNFTEKEFRQSVISAAKKSQKEMVKISKSEPMEKKYTGEVGNLYQVNYSLVDRGDGPRCAWCDQLNPNEEHIKKHVESDGEFYSPLVSDKFKQVSNPYQNEIWEVEK